MTQTLLDKLEARTLEILERIEIQANATGNAAPTAFNEVRNGIKTLAVRNHQPSEASLTVVEAYCPCGRTIRVAQEAALTGKGV